LRKWQVLVAKSPRLLAVFKSCKAIHAAEDLWAEGASHVCVDLESASVWAEGAEDAAAAVSAKYSDFGVSVSAEHPPPSAVALQDAYDKFALFSLELLRPFLSALLKRTEKRSREHALLVLADKPVGVALEGESDRVSIPEVRACVFAHTHPRGALCVPSRGDVDAARSFFLSGGILEVVASPSCVLALWRSWLLGEEDVEAVAELQKRVAKAKELRDVALALRELSSAAHYRYAFLGPPGLL